MTEADVRIAELAGWHFYECGITATGVDALSKAAGISKRTLYERFGSKDGLIVAAYSALDLPVFRLVTAAAEEASSPREQIDALFGHLEVVARTPGFRGCPFANAASELADPDHPARPVIRRHKERVRRWILERARAAGAADPALLSRQLAILFEGAQAQALVQGSARPARDARALARTLMDRELRPGPARGGRKARA